MMFWMNESNGTTNQIQAEATLPNVAHDDHMTSENNENGYFHCTVIITILIILYSAVLLVSNYSTRQTMILLSLLNLGRKHLLLQYELDMV